jgi:hypothetical protein
MGLLQTDSRAAPSVDLAGYRLIPVEKTSQVQPPGMWGVLTWRRPSAVLVQHLDGTEEVITIQDPTRRAQIILLMVGLVGSILMWALKKFSD